MNELFDMNAVCISPTEKARNSMSHVFHALTPVGKDGAVAAVLGWSTTKIIKNDRLCESLLQVHALGFKLVSEDKICVNREELHMLRALEFTTADNKGE